jgi:tRNA pseudouridine55 synthase
VNRELSMHGALLVDKPSGPTSHDVVAFARRALKTPGIGHTGTLDPLATGLLVLLVGHATRLSRFLVTDEKEYLADVRLGQSTATYDADPGFRLKAETTGPADPGFRLKAETTGPADPGFRLKAETTGPAAEAALESRSFRLQPEDIAGVLAQFVGTFWQTPPPFSAKKVAGVRAYKKARKNEAVELKPVEVTVRELELVEPETPDLRPPTSDLRPPTSDLLRLRIVCSSGFYVRSLSHDIGQRLGCGAHLEALRRTRAGRFRVADAVTLDAIEAAGTAIEGRLIGPSDLLAEMPAVTLTVDGSRRADNGNTLAPAHFAAPLPAAPATGPFRVLDPSGRLLSVAERRADGLLHPLLVLR